MIGNSAAKLSAACLNSTVSDTMPAPAADGAWQIDIAMYRSAHARAICDVTNRGLVCAVSRSTFSNRADALAAVPRARNSWFCALMNEFELLIGQLARMRPLETSSQSLQVPVCQNSSDNMPLKIEMLLSEIWKSP